MTHLPRVITQLKDKKIVVLGAGLTGKSCMRFLLAHDLSFSVNDSRENALDSHDFYQEFPQRILVLGHWDSELISTADLLLVSPGVNLAEPAIANAISPTCKVWGDVELYCRINDMPILAITGSNGKSTVVSLLDYLGRALGLNTNIGGNFGVPVLDIVDQTFDMLILELSSFQLESLSSMNAIAGTVLNVSDDHLDRHLTMENYQSVKQGIYHQSNISVINRDDPLTIDNISSNNNIISFGSDEAETGHFGLKSIDNELHLMFGKKALIALKELPLAGIHNALNFLAALALGHCAGWSIDDMVAKLPFFIGLAHRCQRIASNDDIFWVNDSKATNVGATLAAINGLASTLSSTQQLILIAGGVGKGADFSPLKPAIENHVSHLFTLGQDGDEIAALSRQSKKVRSVEEAVIEANKVAQSGDIVLLSPACASFDMFKNFAERGDTFSRSVKMLQEAC